MYALLIAKQVNGCDTLSHRHTWMKCRLNLKKMLFFCCVWLPNEFEFFSEATKYRWMQQQWHRSRPNRQNETFNILFVLFESCCRRRWARQTMSFFFSCKLLFLSVSNGPIKSMKRNKCKTWRQAKMPYVPTHGASFVCCHIWTMKQKSIIFLLNCVIFLGNLLSYISGRSKFNCKLQ